MQGVAHTYQFALAIKQHRFPVPEHPFSMTELTITSIVVHTITNYFYLVLLFYIGENIRDNDVK